MRNFAAVVNAGIRSRYITGIVPSDDKYTCVYFDFRLDDPPGVRFAERSSAMFSKVCDIVRL
jgi:hypothetical protein